LFDVYYIPKLKSNLVSLNQLTEIGHRVVMDEDLIEVSEKNLERMIMRVEPVSLLSSMCDDSWLWHGRLGHVNF
jgi:hypothetical protein